MSNRNALAGCEEEILLLYQQGWRMRQIARKFGVTPGAIGSRLRKMKDYVDSPRRRKWTPFREQLAKQLYLAGHTQQEVAVLLRSNQGRVGKVLQRLGVPARDPYRFGSSDQNPAWNGGTTISKGYRYVYLPEHPSEANENYVLYHRLVMESVIGRFLEPGEVVHHKNGDTLDNRPENLELFASNGEHLAATLKGCVPNWTEEGKRRIAEARRKPRPQRRKKNRSKNDDQA